MALRLMDFVTEDKVEEEKQLYKDGPRVESRPSANDRPLFEILKENKDKKDSELNEKFKHRPPKALDDDETDFLEAVEMHKRDLERQQKEEEARQLISFQTALASRTLPADEPRLLRSHHQPEPPKAPPKNKRPISARVLPISVTITPRPKRVHTESAAPSGPQSNSGAQRQSHVDSASESTVADGMEQKPTDLSQSGLLGLESYGDSSDSDEE